MEIIKTNEIKNRKKNLISMSIFKAYDYENTFNRRFNTFLDKLEIFSLKLKNIDYDLRIYYDFSTEELIKPIIKKYTQFEFYYFNYPPLRVGKQHDGFFGIMSRFLPLFEKEYDYIKIQDVMSESSINKELILEKNNNIDTLFYSIENYNTYYPNSRKYPILGGGLITRNKLPISIFNNFLNDLINEKYRNIILYILNHRNDTYKYGIGTKFAFGMDEYFLNTIAYKYIITENTYIMIGIDIVYIIKQIIRYVINIEKRDMELFKLLIETQQLMKQDDENKEILKTYIQIAKKIGRESLLKYINNSKGNSQRIDKDRIEINTFFDYIDSHKEIDSLFIIKKFKD